jgi:hypothetical protein
MFNGEVRLMRTGEEQVVFSTGGHFLATMVHLRPGRRPSQDAARTVPMVARSTEATINDS